MLLLRSMTVGEGVGADEEGDPDDPSRAGEGDAVGSDDTGREETPEEVESGLAGELAESPLSEGLGDWEGSAGRVTVEVTVIVTPPP